MRKIHHLSSCNTCQRIIDELGLKEKGFVFQDIRTDNISEEELDRARDLVGSYGALFSKRAMKYRGLGLHQQELTEQDLRSYILQEYTFLKRPLIWVDDRLFVGNARKTIEAVKTALNE